MQVTSLCPFCSVEEESIAHLLIHCRFATECWAIVGLDWNGFGVVSFEEWLEYGWAHLDDSHRQLLIVLCWGIWKARNELVWRNKKIPVDFVVVTSRSVLNQWVKAQSKCDVPIAAFLHTTYGHEKWQKPPPGTVKLNVDAALFPELGTFSFACLARDHRGQPIGALSRCFNGVILPELAEAMGFREALSWLKTHNWSSIILETDCLLVIQALRSNVSMLSYFGDVILECKSMLTMSNNVSCLFVKRSANNVAHAIAKASYSPADRIFKDGEFPSSNLNVIHVDTL